MELEDGGGDAGDDRDARDAGTQAEGELMGLDPAGAGRRGGVSMAIRRLLPATGPTGKLVRRLSGPVGVVASDVDAGGAGQTGGERRSAWTSLMVAPRQRADVERADEVGSAEVDPLETGAVQRHVGQGHAGEA